MQRLVARFDWIGADRMRDLPLYHHGLQVEAVDSQPRVAGWLGVPITPGS